MIDIIGAKRFFIFLLFLGTNIALALAAYFYISPESMEAEKRLKRIQKQVSQAQSDLDRMQIEFDQLEKEQDRFDALKHDGFFTAQVRSRAKDIFGEIRSDSRVISAVVNVKPGVIEDNAEAKKVKHKVLTSFVDIKIRAFDDSDIYRYLDLIEKRFPGHMSLDSIDIMRIRDVNKIVLRAIASGANPELVGADMRMTWRTLIPEAEVIEE